MRAISDNTEYDDDAPMGRVLSRRDVLALFAGLGGAALLAACNPLESGSAQPAISPTQTSAGSSQPPTASTQTPLNAEAGTAVAATPVQASPTADVAAVPDCVVRPELTEGPYFVDEKLNRSDIRFDPSNNTVKDGVPLVLAFVVSQVGTGSCMPIKGVQVDIWHCDAMGVYSDVQGSTGTKFLRGYQVTGDDGKATYTTIYPGWYRGRAVHIHFKIRTTGTSGAAYEFTSQFFFDDAFSDQIYARQPYSQHSGRDTQNSADGIYQGGGNQLMLSPTKSGDGYAVTFPIGLDLSNTQVGQSDSNQQGGGGPGGPGGPPPGQGSTPTP